MPRGGHFQGRVVTQAPVSRALTALRAAPEAKGWLSLPFFTDGHADRVAARVDAAIAAGATIAPTPDEIFSALRLTPLDSVKAVILGQDPYPTAGDAHGLAFSYRGKRAFPASLRVILSELVADLGCAKPVSGDLSAWARQGVLLLNTALSVETGNAGAHLRFGWSQLADEAVASVSRERPHAVFMLWGNPARARAMLVDREKHLVLESGHPSPLNRARDFPGSRPFSAANAWLGAQGIAPIDWQL